MRPWFAGNFGTGPSGGEIQRRAAEFGQHYPSEATGETHRGEGRERERGSVML